MTLPDALDFVLAHEGGLVHDPRDPGGVTKYGISQRAYPDLEIATLTLDQARAIYRRDYWLAAGCDRWPWPISLAVFDSAVNHGVTWAIRALQRAVGVGDDGVIGPATEAAVRRADLQRTVLAILADRGVLYDKHPLDYRGWYRRICALAWRAGATCPA